MVLQNLLRANQRCIMGKNPIQTTILIFHKQSHNPKVHENMIIMIESCEHKGVRPSGVDHGGEKVEAPPILGLRTILGLLSQSLTYMGSHIRLWVQSLDMD